VIKHNGDYIEGPVNVFCKINSFLKRKPTVCRTSEMTHVNVFVFSKSVLRDIKLRSSKYEDLYSSGILRSTSW
jgi:hypothetical protein